MMQHSDVIFVLIGHYFLRISDVLVARYEYCQQKPYARCGMGFSTIQKYAIVFRYLGYFITYDASNEYLKVSEWTPIECRSFLRMCL